MQGYLRDIACICTKAFCRARGDPPEKVVFYYNGLTKGSYERAYKYSISLIKYGIQEGNNNKSIPLTFIAVNKKNGLRLFPERVCKFSLFQFAYLVNSKTYSLLFNKQNVI